MGQAFDRDGNVLGEAEGDSMEKVEFLAGATTAPNVMADRMMQFFAVDHLPAHLQIVSRPFGDLAATVVATLPSNPERTVALRKLLEAKDCAVRALLFK